MAALTGALALPASGAPLATRTSAAAVSTPTPAPVPTAGGTSRPVPAAWHAGMVRASRTAWAAAVAHPVGAVDAAGLRPVPGSPQVSTDLPARVEIGAPDIRVRFTVDVPTTAQAASALDVALLDADGNLAAEHHVVATAHQGRFTGGFTVPVSSVQALGAGLWSIGYGSPTGMSDEQVALPTTVKLRSLLAERVTRVGDSVRVIGAVKTYTNTGGDDHGPAIGQRVLVQRWTRTGWATLTTATSDRYGHVATTLRISFRAGIRLATADTPLAFGASTAQTVV